ncbi:protein FAM200A-like, partial [Aphis craccivora]
MDNAKICGDIRVMFSKLKNEVLDKSEEIPENLSQILTNKDDAIDDLCEVKVMNLNVSESMFKKPLPLMLDNYFEYHPLQPVSHTFFNCKKVLYKADGTNRFWLTFDGKSLFCTVCLAFGSKNNSFVLGMNTWSHTYQRIQENENILEHNASIEAYFLHVHKTNIDNLLFVNQLNSRKILIKQRLNALERIIDVVKLIGKRSLSYRGKHNEAAYTLHNDSIDHGNFLDILLLLKKYDVVLHEYLDNIIKKSQVSHNSGNKTRGGLLTLISKTTVNQIIECISDLIKKYIASQIVEAEMFSVKLDTTQDVAVKDQCAIVIRYVNSNGIHEKLIAVVNCIDSSGKGIFKLLSKVLTNNNLNIKYCIANATDGAASMQGIYNGFSKWLSDEFPGNVHVWCYSHILNLVLSDITKTSIATASVFSLLNGLAAFFKESYQRMAVWSKATRSDVKHRKFQLIGETSIKSTDCLYIELLISLYEIETSEHFSIEIRSKAKNFKESMLKYSTLFTAFMYLRIYKITSPLSKYLQTSRIDLHKSQQLVDIAHKELQHIKRDVKGLKKQLDIIIETELPKLRLRKKKKAFEELTEDDPI